MTAMCRTPPWTSWRSRPARRSNLLGVCVGDVDEGVRLGLDHSRDDHELSDLHRMQRLGECNDLALTATHLSIANSKAVGLDDEPKRA